MHNNVLCVIQPRDTWSKQGNSGKKNTFAILQPKFSIRKLHMHLCIQRPWVTEIMRTDVNQSTCNHLTDDPAPDRGWAHVVPTAVTVEYHGPAAVAWQLPAEDRERELSWRCCLDRMWNTLEQSNLRFEVCGCLIRHWDLRASWFCALDFCSLCLLITSVTTSTKNWTSGARYKNSIAPNGCDSPVLVALISKVYSLHQTVCWRELSARSWRPSRTVATTTGGRLVWMSGGRAASVLRKTVTSDKARNGMEYPNQENKLRETKLWSLLLILVIPNTLALLWIWLLAVCSLQSKLWHSNQLHGSSKCNPSPMWIPQMLLASQCNS